MSSKNILEGIEFAGYFIKNKHLVKMNSPVTAKQMPYKKWRKIVKRVKNIR